MIENLTKIYDGIDLSGANPNIIYLPVLAERTLTGVDVLTDAAVSGNAVFSLKLNGVAVSGATAITIAAASKIGSVSGLEIALAKGDEFTLDMVSGSAVSVPLTLNLVTDSGAGAAQTTQTFSTASIASAAFGLLDIAIAKHSIVRKISTNVPARIRAYALSSDRLTDAERPIGSESGTFNILLEAVTETGNLNLNAKEAAILFNADNPVTDTIYWNIQNLSDATNVVSVTITKLNLEN